MMPFKTIHDGQKDPNSLSQNVEIYLNILAKNFQKKKKECMTLKEFGYSQTQRWFEVFETEPEDSLYIRNMMQAGEKLSKGS